MKYSLVYFLILFTSFGIISCSKTDIIESRKTSLFNTNWQFIKGEEADGEWVTISIPHTPKIEPLIVNDQWQGTLWYKKEFRVSDKNKKYFLNFGGVMHEADLWINDQWVQKHVGGYLPFIADITEYLDFDGVNVVKLKVNNEDNAQIPPGKALNVLDFNYYGGIYRKVSLVETNTTYITNPVLLAKEASGGVLVHFNEVSAENAIGTVQIHVKNESDQEKELACSVVLIGPEGKKFIFDSKKNIVKSGSDSEFMVDVSVASPALWSVKKPSLYKMEIHLYANNEKTDNYELNIGIRKIKLSHEGFYLNNEKIYIRGTNRHQEYPYVGYAITENANWRDAIKIKQAGFDFVRLSHYPQDESFLDACDALGLLVMNAIPGWQFFGDSTFVQNSFQDIRDMVRRDRNHPSVVFWEVSLNESGMTGTYMAEANKILKDELPFDDTYSAGWIDNNSFDLYIPARQHSSPPDYWNEYKVNERPLFIAEYGDWEYYAHNAGFNQTEFKNLQKDERTSRQLRGYGEKRLLQQAMNYQEAVNSNRKGKANSIGDANWLMFDYNRGYADDIESSGISDIFRIPKFAFWFYQSQRPPFDTLAIDEGTGPMVRIASYWTEESNTSGLRVFSNCEEVELYLNNKLIGKHKPTIDKYSDHLPFPPFHFNLQGFKAGTLKAIGFINGKEVALDEIRTPLDPKDVILEADKSGIEISKTDSDLLFIYAKIADANGTLCNLEEAEVTFVLVGNGELIGENPVKAEAGIATILLKTKPGEKYKISASSSTLESANIEL